MGSRHKSDVNTYNKHADIIDGNQLRRASLKLHNFVLIVCFGSIVATSPGCVSLPFHTSHITRSNKAQYKPPASPFQSYPAADVDAAWKNMDTGNIISVVSECGLPGDPSLVKIRNDITLNLEDLNINKQGLLEFHGQKALRSRLSARVDGVTSDVELLLFKKYGCFYILTYVANPTSVLKDQQKFNQFIAGFNVP